MPEIRDYYIHVKDMDIAQLHTRALELKAGATQYRDMGDEALAELLAVTREMRKRAAIGTRRGGTKKPKSDKESLEALI
jgi:hypothetical protein